MEDGNSINVKKTLRLRISARCARLYIIGVKIVHLFGREGGLRQAILIPTVYA